MAGISIKFLCRFYEPNSWYKARIAKPILYPKMFVIDPDEHLLSLKERLAGCLIYFYSPSLAWKPFFRRLFE